MRRVPFIFLFFGMLVLTSCAQNEFDRSLRSGKDYLHVSQYEDAIKQFDIALIEKPSDKDAALLMDRAKKGLEEQKSIEVLQQYQDGNSPIFSDYTKIFLEVNLKDSMGVFAKIAYLEDLKSIYSRALDLGRKYNKYSKISEAHDEFIRGLDSYIRMFEEAKTGGSQFRVNQYRGIHDDYMQSYKDKIAALKKS